MKKNEELRNALGRITGQAEPQAPQPEKGAGLPAASDYVNGLIAEMKKERKTKNTSVPMSETAYKTFRKLATVRGLKEGKNVTFSTLMNEAMYEYIKNHAELIEQYRDLFNVEESAKK